MSDQTPEEQFAQNLVALSAYVGVMAAASAEKALVPISKDSVRRAKVAALRAKFLAGSLTVDTAVVATKLVKSHLPKSPSKSQTASPHAAKASS